MRSLLQSLTVEEALERSLTDKPFLKEITDLAIYVARYSDTFFIDSYLNHRTEATEKYLYNLTIGRHSWDCLTYSYLTALLVKNNIDLMLEEMIALIDEADPELNRKRSLILD